MITTWYEGGILVSPPLQHATFFETRYSSLSRTGFHLLFHLRECCIKRALTVNDELSSPPRRSFSYSSLSSEQAGITRQQKIFLPSRNRRELMRDAKDTAQRLHQQQRHEEKDLLCSRSFNLILHLLFRLLVAAMATSCDETNRNLEARHTLFAINNRPMYRAFMSSVECSKKLHCQRTCILRKMSCSIVIVCWLESNVYSIDIYARKLLSISFNKSL